MGDGDAFAVSKTGLKILILEDDALAAAAFAAALRDNGHEVVGIADSAQEGLAKARDDDADLALVDIGLADGRTGLAAARTLRDHFTSRRCSSAARPASPPRRMQCVPSAISPNRQMPTM
jgi:DNA-binding NarL/FixJ family response regulator